MEKRNLGGKLRTIADVKPQRAPNPLDMLMTASGLRAIAQDPQFDNDRDIIQKIVAEDRDLFESQLRLAHAQGVYHQVIMRQGGKSKEDFASKISKKTGPSRRTRASGLEHQRGLESQEDS